MQEIICKYIKRENVKWVSHLETVRALEWALRRADIPIAYSEGYNPHPRLAMGPALPAGMTSEAEVAAFFLAQRMDPEEFKERLNSNLPKGFFIKSAWALSLHEKKRTLGDINTAEYHAFVKGPAEAEELQRRAVGLLSYKEIPFTRQREKKTQHLDLRPLILQLAVEETDEGTCINMTLRTGSSGGVRPHEVLEQLGVKGEEWESRFHRTALYAGSDDNQPKIRSERFRNVQQNRFKHHKRN